MPASGPIEATAGPISAANRGESDTRQSRVCRDLTYPEPNTAPVEQITLRVREGELEAIDEEADSEGKTRSEYIRDVLESRTEHAELQTEVERLRREKRMVLEQREEKKELARYVDEEREWRRAPIWKRAKWWLTGKGG